MFSLFFHEYLLDIIAPQTTQNLKADLKTFEGRLEKN